MMSVSLNEDKQMGQSYSFKEDEKPIYLMFLDRESSNLFWRTHSMQQKVRMMMPSTKLRMSENMYSRKYTLM